jgi:branched-chain amino acid transport system permease protein
MANDIITQSIIIGFSSAGIYILIALGLSLVLSIMGIVQLAHGEIYMLGAYGVYYLFASAGLDFYVSLILSALIVGAFGIFLERTCFRPFRGQPNRSLIIAIGLISILQNIMLAVAGGDPKGYKPPFSGVLKVMGITIAWDRLVIIIIGVILLTGLLIFIRTTRTGKAMSAISQSLKGAALQGINIDRISSIAMFMGCALAAVAGALVGAIFSLSPTMGSTAMMQGIAVIVLGGFGSLPGTIIGGFILGMINGIMPVFTTTYIAELIGFGMIILFMIFRPQGIWGHE